MCCVFRNELAIWKYNTNLTNSDKKRGEGKKGPFLLTKSSETNVRTDQCYKFAYLHILNCSFLKLCKTKTDFNSFVDLFSFTLDWIKTIKPLRNSKHCEVSVKCKRHLDRSEMTIK